jgi:hypothetical protein
MTHADPGTLAAVFAALYAAHQVADHWVQTQHQADHKGDPGWRGRLACVAHVATYTVTQCLTLAAVGAVTGAAGHPVTATLGIAVSAVTHYIADRRTPLRRMADALRKSPAWLERGGGLYALDQAWHVGWLFVAALLIAF